MSVESADIPLGDDKDSDFESAFQQLSLRVKEIQGDFEETQLNQELWSSVDLLENIGIQNNLVFKELDALLEQGEASVEQIKAALREGRARFSDWLFRHFENRAGQEESTAAIVDAFSRLFDRLADECSHMPDHLDLPLEESHFAPTDTDSPLVQLGKAGKRAGRGMGLKTFHRRFSPRNLALHHLTVRLPNRLEAVVEKLGEAELFLLRRLKGLYEEIDRSYNGLLKIIDAEKMDGVARLVDLKAELSESFRLSGSEVVQYFAEVSQDFDAGFKAVLGEMSEAGRNTGALGYPEYRYRRESRDAALKALRGKVDHWVRYQTGFTGYYLMELEIARFQNRLRRAVDQSVIRVNDRLRLRLAEVSQKVEAQCQPTFAYLEKGWKAEENTDMLRAGIERQRSGLIDFLRNQVHDNLQALGNSAEIGQLIDLVREGFKDLADEIKESFLVVEEEDVMINPDYIRRDPVVLKVAPIRAVVRTYLDRDLVLRLGEVNESMLALVRRTDAQVDELWHVVNFSLGNVAVELREDGKVPDKLVSVAHSRLKRALETFIMQCQAVGDDSLAIHDKAVAAVADTARLLKQLVLEETVGVMRQRIEDADSNGIKNWTSKQVGALGQLWRTWMVETAVNSPTTPGAGEPATGVEQAADIGSVGWLEDEQELLRRVPFAYRQLFSTNPLEVSEFLSGRSQALGAIEQALARWRQGHFSSVVVIGDQGSGKTSLINCAMEQILKGVPLVRHRVSATLTGEKELLELLNEVLDLDADTLELLEKQVQASHVRRMVILEDIHRLHLRAWGGLALIRRLLAFIDATGSHILWFVSIDQYAWQYLIHVAAMDRHFAFRLETGRLGPDELEGAIMARHRATGYGVRFMTSDGREDGNQQRLHREFFDRLSAACGGNVFAAIFYWLRSIQQVDANILCISPLEELHLEFLASLELDEVLDLAMVIEHGGLSPVHFAMVFQLELDEASTRLKRLEHLGTLANAGQSYDINPVLYHPIVGEIKKRHVFY
jgi:hypothetical protein